MSLAVSISGFTDLLRGIGKLLSYPDWGMDADVEPPGMDLRRG